MILKIGDGYVNCEGWVKVQFPTPSGMIISYEKRSPIIAKGSSWDIMKAHELFEAMYQAQAKPDPIQISNGMVQLVLPFE